MWDKKRFFSLRIRNSCLEVTPSVPYYLSVYLERNAFSFILCFSFPVSLIFKFYLKCYSVFCRRVQSKIHSSLLKKTMKHCFNWHEKCCSYSVWKEDCIFILLQVLNCFCANVVMVINEVAENHVMTAVPHSRNLPTHNSSPDEDLVHFVHKCGEI